MPSVSGAWEDYRFLATTITSEKSTSALDAKKTTRKQIHLLKLGANRFLASVFVSAFTHSFPQI